MLNKEQEKAANVFEGHICVNAGAGSGKTRVLVTRIANMLKAGIAPDKILAFTFTRKAADEMKERLESLGAHSDITCGTIHSVFWKIIQDEHKEAFPGRFNNRIGIIRHWEIKKVTKEIFDRYFGHSAELKPNDLKSFISRAKNLGLSPKEYREHLIGAGHEDFFAEKMMQSYLAYEKEKTKIGKIDFDDMLILTRDIFLSRPDILETYQKRWQYISVDEYQDINPIQEQVIDMLAHLSGNLFVVGDARQCVEANTKIKTTRGEMPASKVKDGEQILSACGDGEVEYAHVEKAWSRDYTGPMITIKTKNGYSLTATPNHTCFSKLPEKNNYHYVYVMSKSGLGFRIGKTQGYRWHCKSTRGRMGNGLKGRCTQEGADAIWLVEVCKTPKEAALRELELSVEYNIPQTMFKPRGDLDCEAIKRVFSLSQEYSRVKDLFADYNLDEDFPHYRPMAVTHGNTKRSHINFAAFSGKGRATRVSIDTSNEDIIKSVKSQEWRKAKKGFKIEKHRHYYDDALNIALRLQRETGLPINKTAVLNHNGAYSYQPMGNMRVGMIVPIEIDGKIVEDEIIDVSSKISFTRVFDFSVARNRNFIAGGICVHNSIYSFRGSEPKYIVEFEKKYRGAIVIDLPRNYRCGSTILEAANSLIARNSEGQKPMIAESGLNGNISIVPPMDFPEDEADYVVNAITDSGKKFMDHAILYRCNYQSRVVEDALIKRSIPYEIIGSEGFYGRREIKDMVSYMALALEWDDLKNHDHFERVYSKPVRYIGAKFLEEWNRVKESQGAISCLDSHNWKYPAVSNRSVSNVRKFYEDMCELRSLIDSPTSFVAYIRSDMGYDSWFLDDAGEEANVDGEEVLDNLNEFSASAENFRSVQSMWNYIQETIRKMSEDPSGNKVRLMTLHRAKGLEFPVVHIVGANDALMPHSKASNIAEERRLMYVGVTRAKENLYISYYTNHRNQSVTASPFIEEMSMGELGIDENLADGEFSLN